MPLLGLEMPSVQFGWSRGSQPLDASSKAASPLNLLNMAKIAASPLDSSSKAASPLNILNNAITPDTISDSGIAARLIFESNGPCI